MIEKVVFIGAGNLATQLALALAQNGIRVIQIFSRTPHSAKLLAQKVNASFTDDLSLLKRDADLYIVAVKDSAIGDVLQKLNLDTDQMIVHTAGSIPMKILNGCTNNYGVFYPLQTFSKDRHADFSSIPVLIEANDTLQLIKLQKLAQGITSYVYEINSEERKTIHLAAVFVNNFVNHLYAVGAELLNQKSLDFNLLIPLIQETAQKIMVMHPLDAQTGPARRKDEAVIANHLKMLESTPELTKIYSFISESIYLTHQNKKHDLL